MLLWLIYVDDTVLIADEEDMFARVMNGFGGT